MQITIAKTLEDVRALEAEWGALAPSHPYAAWDFAYDWLTSVPSAQPFVIAVRQGGQLVAVAPWCLIKGRADSLSLTGVGYEGAWYHDPVLAPDMACEPIARALAGALRSRQWDLIDLILQADSSMPLASALQRFGMSVMQRPRERQSRLLALAADWPSTWERFPSSFRKTVERRSRKLAQRPHRFFQVTGDETMDVLEELIRFNRLRWQTGANWEETYAVMRAHTPTLLARGKLRLFALELDGRLAAIDYQIRQGDRSFMLMANYHSDFAELSPGNLLMHWGLEQLQREGVRAADMGPGEYAWKQQLASTLVETVRIRVGSSLRGLALVGWRDMIKPRLMSN